MYYNIVMRKEFLYFLYTVFFATVLIFMLKPTKIFAVDWPQIPKEYTNFMAPGVPYDASCTPNVNYNLIIKLQGPQKLTANKTDIFKIVISNQSEAPIKLSGIRIFLQTLNDKLQIVEVTPNLKVCQDIQVQKNDSSASITMPASCGEITLASYSTLTLAELKLKAAAPGKSSIVLKNEQGVSNVSLASPKNAQVKLQAIPLNLTIVQPQETPMPTPPNTAIRPLQLSLLAVTLITLVVFYKLAKKHSIISYEQID